jgi:hypothetical protein
MTRRYAWYVVLFVAITCGVPTSVAGAVQGCDRTEVRRAIEELRKIGTPEPVYVEDGAADGTLLVQPPSGKPLPLVERIIACPDEAGPELIACLDDERITQIQCKTKRTSFKPQGVPMGYLCLDLLLALTESNPIVSVLDCADDGLGACVHSGYYFRPDDYVRTGPRLKPLPVVYKVKKAWVRLLKSGGMRFRYPL